VRAAFDAYEEALMAERVEDLIEAFWASPAAARFGVDEIQYGHDAIAAFRREHGSASSPRRLRNTVVTTFGDDVATVDTHFVPTGATAAVGRQSQTWVRTDRGWRVASAHVSWLGGVAPR
jgi:hypothetical protein